MVKHEIMAMPSQLKASARFEFAEKIMQTMDKPDAEIDRVWAEAALRRARTCDKGWMKTLPFDEVFGNE